MLTIHNDALSVTISPVGAEVQSITDRKTGREYLWSGDPKWWHGHSPILFPIVGALWDGVCRIDGREVRIPKHGILRQALWRPEPMGPDHVRFVHISTVGDFAAFPFAFVITADYRLEGRSLIATIEVENPGGADMWFQLGGHPAIALPDWDETHDVDGYLRLEGKPEYVVRAGEQGCIEPGRHAVPHTADGLVPLTVETFAHEALIFPDHQVTGVTVLDRERRPVARVTSGSDVWLFWSPQGVHTPFICCEPWYGLCDNQGFNGPVSERTGINRLAPHTTWQGGYTIELPEA